MTQPAETHRDHPEPDRASDDLEDAKASTATGEEAPERLGEPATIDHTHQG